MSVFLEQNPQGSGLQLGSGVYLLFGGSNPNSRTDALLTASSAPGSDSVNTGSVFLQTGSSPALWQKTGAIVWANGAPSNSGTWTQIT